MPELPEVETIRRDLIKKISGVKIKEIEVLKNKAVDNKKKKFISIVQGNAVSAIERRGKLMIFKLEKGSDSVLVHLKMTGQLIYEKILPPLLRPPSGRGGG